MKPNYLLKPLLIIFIIFSWGCDSEKSLYEKATNTQAFYDYAKYLRKYPEGQHAILFKAKIDSLKQEMRYIVNNENWRQLFDQYAQQYPAMHKAFFLKDFNVTYRGLSKEDEDAGMAELREVWNRPITKTHFDRVNVLGCWIRGAVYYHGASHSLMGILYLQGKCPLILHVILQDDILENNSEESVLLKRAVLDMFKDIIPLTNKGSGYKQLLEKIKGKDQNPEINKYASDLLSNFE